MEAMHKWILRLWGGAFGLLMEVEEIMVPCLIFISMDFVLGVATDVKASIKKGEKFGVQSGKLWKTLSKIIGVGIAIILTQLYTNSYIDWLGINLGKIIAGVIAAIELYSILGHLCYLTDWYGFNVIKSIFKKEIEAKVGHKIDE